MVDVILDTDIGANVDDMLALLLLATDTRIALRAVTTVDGDVHLRAHHALHILQLLGRDDVPVHAGTATPASGRDAWPLDNADRSVQRVRPDGVEELVETVRRSPGEVTVVAIGPLTNIVAAISRDDSWVSLLRRLVIMGGDFTGSRTEHNVASDVDAARSVLESGAPIMCIGLDVTTTVPFDSSDLDILAATGSPLAPLIADQARAWWQRIGRTSSHPHDALAALTLLEPDLFEVGRGRWRVSPGGALTPDPGAPAIARATAVDVAAARAVLHRRWSTALNRAG